MISPMTGLPTALVRVCCCFSYELSLMHYRLFDALCPWMAGRVLFSTPYAWLARLTFCLTRRCTDIHPGLY